MKNKIQVDRYTHTHYHSGCNQCDFSAARNTEETPEPADVIRAVRKHVKQTGHKCWVEGASTTYYSLIDSDVTDASL